VSADSSAASNESVLLNKKGDIQRVFHFHTTQTFFFPIPKAFMSIVKQRSHFSSSSNDILSYYLYQPSCILVEPFLAKNGIVPNEISATRCLAGVAAGAAIVASSIDAGNGRRWLWICGALLCILCIGISDDLDGYIARKYDLKSEAGKYVDGIADVGGWIVTWLAMLYAFGFGRVVYPFLAWCLLAAYGFFPKVANTRDTHHIKVRTFQILHSTIFPLSVALFYACYPMR